jgi:hypothetical protein
MEFDFPAENPTIRRPPVRSSNPFLFPMIIIGGGMGILAAYGALALISGNSPLKPKLIVADRPTPAPKVTPDSSSMTDSRLIPPRRKSVEPPRSSAVAELNAFRDVHSTTETQADPPLPPPDEPPDKHQPIGHTPVEKPLGPFDLPKPSAIATLTLNDPVIKVIAAAPNSTVVSNVLCDVGFSPNLLGGFAGKDYQIVAAHLGNHSTYVQELPLHINGAGAAVEIKVAHQLKSAICELRPQFSLPGVRIQPMTNNRATTVHKNLSRALDEAAHARENMGAMTARLSDLQSQIATAQANLTATGANPADTGLIRHNARMALPGLNRSLSNQKKAVAAAKDVIAAESGNRTDLNDLEQIGEYAQQIASVATIYVRFYVGDTTIPATVRLGLKASESSSRSLPLGWG